MPHYTSPLAEALAPGLLERFERYVRIATQSARDRTQSPSTPGQLDLSRLISNDGLGVDVDSACVMARNPMRDPAALASRISADAYEAMTSDRPYRDAPGQEYAIAELRRHAGTQFDAEVATVKQRDEGFRHSVQMLTCILQAVAVRVEPRESVDARQRGIDVEDLGGRIDVEDRGGTRETIIQINVADADRGGEGSEAKVERRQ